ncbi:hypothetical protein [Microbacterium hydrocarbonoxydans]|uniref:hypothetical protein n=1 Tax=Microbacterium hydrocarbonoxydans TaxID=273678 RepID=UPI0013DAF8EB|nr:hypothetical protein [Microbacterium hydrocarbonoxydans]
MLATVSFFALAIFGLGALSVATGTDIISVPGLGQVPGAAGMLAALAGFALMLWSSVRRPHPSFLAVPAAALVTALAHLVAVWSGVLFGTGDVIVSTVVAGDLVRGGASAVLLLVAAVAAWGGIALRRTRAQHPRWPWEREEEE